MHTGQTLHTGHSARRQQCHIFLKSFPLLFSILREVWSEASAGHTYMGGGAWKRKKRIKELKAASFEWKICLRSFKKTDRKR